MQDLAPSPETMSAFKGIWEEVLTLIVFVLGWWIRRSIAHVKSEVRVVTKDLRAGRERRNVTLEELTNQIKDLNDRTAELERICGVEAPEDPQGPFPEA